tara:strand:- start:75333 stop:77264 length:1932 start_codon:yes stop_codon:yes gene_type:complete
MVKLMDQSVTRIRPKTISFGIAFLLAASFSWGFTASLAQDAGSLLQENGSSPQETGSAPQSTGLAERQTGVAQRYQRLEELLLRLADVEATENPERAALLRRAARQSRDQFVLNKIQSASDALRTQQFQSAVENQGDATEGLQAMLKLLLSEDRSKRIRDEKERIANLIKNIKRIERAQRSTRAKAENGAELDDVLKDQQSIGDRSEELSQELSESNASDADPSDAESSNSSDEQEDSKSDKNDQDQQDDSGDEPSQEDEESKESKDSKDNDEPSGEEEGAEQEGSKSKSSDSESSKSKASQSSESKSEESKSSESKSSESKSSESQSSESQSSESQSSESQSSESESEQSQSDSPQSDEQSPQSNQPQSPEQQAEQSLKQAIEKMRQAEKELEDAKRDKATGKQREAEENLRQAIDRLEKILRQLREEEMQRELARLEARFRKMAAMQSQVLDDTVTLSATPKTQRNRQTDLKSGELAFEEKKITLEADRAMLLLREEGSSVAFPEVVSQIRDDTMRVTDRLGQSKIDAVTQGIQQDILAALEEMIGALQKAQRDLEKQRQQQQQPPSGGSPGEQPLVQALAELKLIRTMETRVKSTTERYSGLLESGESTTDDVLPLLQNLSERQNRLYRITRDLVLKRNQ